MSKTETITVSELNARLRERGIQVDYGLLNRKLFLLHQLWAASYDVSRDLERDFEALGVYKFEVKHAHKEIKRLLSKQTQALYRSVSLDDFIDFGTDTDSLISLLYEWAGIKGKEE